MSENIPIQQMAEVAPVSAGAQLKAAREEKGLSLVQVAAQLKLSARQVAALEADDFSSLPGNTFVRGFVRNYARYLELDSQQLLDCLATTLPQERVQIAMPPVSDASAYEKEMAQSRTRWSWLVWVFVLLGLLLGATGVFWYLQKPTAPDITVADVSRFQEHQTVAVDAQAAAISTQAGTSPQAPSVSSAIEVPAPPALQVSAPAEAGGIRQPAMASAVSDAGKEGAAIRIVTVEASSWVQVVDSDDRVLISQLVAPHGERTASGRPPYRLKIGNAPKAKLYYRGQAVDLTPHIRGDVATLELR